MTQDPSQAGQPRTRGERRAYPRPEITVYWDASRCIHTGLCVQGLPGVFDLGKRPWIDVEGADPEQIAEVIRRCPTGALRYDGPGVPAEVPDDPTVVEVRINGPLFVRGRVRVQKPGDRVITEEHRVALCRCGASENKPFCDNSHRLIGWKESSETTQ